MLIYREVYAMNKPYWWDEDEDGEWSDDPPVLDVPLLDTKTERVCCSCNVRDFSLQFGCGNCGRPVHYREPECGSWLLDSWHDETAIENEFWCRECLAACHPSVAEQDTTHYIW